MADEQGIAPKTLTAAAQSWLMTHEFPGNIRELENMLARASAMTESSVIDAGDLVPGDFFDNITRQLDDSTPQGQDSPSAAPVDLLTAVAGDLEGYMAAREREILNDALVAHRWNRTATAKALGISFRSLRYRLKKLGLED